MNLGKVTYWSWIGAVTVVLLNSSATFGADVSPDRAQLDPGIVRLPLSPAAGRIVGNSSIHDKVIEDLQRDQSMREDSLLNKGNASAGDVPTSMLWPTHKYVPQLSNAVTA